MAKTDTVYMRIDPTLKSNAEAVLAPLGMTPNEAINIFLSQVVLRRGIPFEVVMPAPTKDEAIQWLMAEIKKGQDSYENEPHLTLSELKEKLGI